MAGISVGGLTSGIDYDSLVQGLLRVQRIPLDRLAAQKSTLGNKNATYTDLIGMVNRLKSAAEALRSEAGFTAKTATVSDPGIVTVNATASATTGNYSLVVHERALEHSLVSGNGLASTEDTVAAGAGRFTFKIGETGAEHSVDVDETLTLEAFKNALNALEDENGNRLLRAVIVNEGFGDTPNRLVLSGLETGAGQTVIVTEDDTALGFPVNDVLLASDLHLQKPQDARMELNGLTVYRSGNTVTDLIPGVSLSLHKADPDTAVSIQVENDRESVKGKVRELLDAYNETVGFIRARDTYSTADQNRGVLYAEGTTRSLVQRIAGIATAGVEGLPEEMRSLSQLGVKTTRDGTLSLDEGVLDQALKSDPDKVMNVFLRGTGADGVAEQLYQVAHQATRAGDGLLTRRQDGFTSVTRDLDRRIEAQEGMLKRYEVRLRAEFAALESLITSLQGNVAHLPTEILSYRK